MSRSPQRSPGARGPSLIAGRSRAAVHVRRRRIAVLVTAASVAGLAGLVSLVALVAGASSDDAARVAASPRPAGARPGPPPPDPLAPRSIRATGELAAVPLEGRPAGEPTGIGFAVEVEEGVEVDRAAFARAVERTLLDPRGWTGEDAYSLRRADADEAGFRVTLASPQTTDRLCAPLQTKGIYSCHQNGRAVLKPSAGRTARPPTAATSPATAGTWSTTKLDTPWAEATQTAPARASSRR